MNTLQKTKLRGTGINCGLIVLLFAIAAIIRVMKGQDARLPLLSKFSDWAFGFANQDQN